MEFFKIKKDIPFMRHALVFNVISLITFLAAVFFLATKGLNFSVEFTGGTLIEVEYAQPADTQQIRESLAKVNYTDTQVVNFGSSREVLIRMPLKPGQDSAALGNNVMGVLQAANSDAQLKRVEFVGPQVGKELQRSGLIAIGLSLVGMIVYITIRFEWKFAVVAILTTLFDVLVTAAFFSWSGRDFDLTVLAGLLAVMGFSINDTIVVFDRVRENFRSMRAEPLEVLNTSINQTLSRTIITSVVAFLTVLALYIYGGDSLKGMAEAQMIGIVIGTLSSIFISCALLTMGPLRVSKQDLMPKAKDHAELARRP